MNEYVEYIKHVINREINLFAIRNYYNEDHLNVFKVTPSKNDLVCTVIEANKHSDCLPKIIVRYEEKYIPKYFPPSTNLRCHCNEEALIKEIQEVILEKSKGDNNMKEDRFTLNTKFIPALNRNGIKFRYIGGVYDPMAIKYLESKYKSSNSLEPKPSDPVPIKSENNDYHGGFTTWRNEYQKERDKFEIRDVIFNDPATIVLWADGTKTVVKAENEEFDPEKGLAMAIAKKTLGNNYDYYDIFKKYIGRYEKKNKKG